MSVPLGQSIQPPSTLSISTTVSETETLSSYDENMADILDMQRELSKFEPGMDEPPKRRPPVLPPPPTIPAPPLPPEATNGNQKFSRLSSRSSSGTSINRPASIDIQQGRRSLDVGGKNVESLSPNTTNTLNSMMTFTPSDLNEQQNGLAPPQIITNPPSEVMTNGSNEYPARPLSIQGEELYYDMIEYANKHFNDHMREVGGTLMKNFRKKKNQEDVSSSIYFEFYIFCFLI